MKKLFSFLTVILCLIACSGCSSHHFGEWTVVTPASCEQDGLSIRTCTNPDCGCVQERVIRAGHQFDFYLGEFREETPVFRLEIMIQDGKGAVLLPKEQAEAVSPALIAELEKAIRRRFAAMGVSRYEIQALEDNDGRSALRVLVKQSGDLDEICRKLMLTAEFEVAAQYDGGEYADQTILNNSHITDAQCARDQNGDWAVLVRLNQAGSDMFAEVTGDLAVYNRALDIRLDGQVVCSATVLGKVTSGEVLFPLGSYEEAVETSLKLTSPLPIAFDVDWSGKVTVVCRVCGKEKR